MFRKWYELIHYKADEGGGGSTPPAPGTGEEAPGVIEPGTVTEPNDSDTGETPGPIPYSRFREVNEARRSLAERFAPYDELEQAGYRAEDLHRLAAWEQEYIQDPGGWLTNQLLNTEGVPESVKAAVAAAKGTGSADPNPAGEGKPSEGTSEDLPQWAKELLQERDQRRAQEQADATASAMDSIVEAWKELDKRDNITTPERSLYSYIAAAAQSGITEAAQLLRAARESWLEDRSAVLGQSVSQVRSGEAPLSVPGGGGGDATLQTPRKPKTLDEARKLAEEADRRGGLVVT